MFELFKKEKDIIVNTMTIPDYSKYPKGIKEIHEKFFTASDSILEEVKQILKEAEIKDVDKARRLKNLGFINTIQVKNFEESKEKIELSEKLINLINYYSIYYPNNKFITREQVTNICTKYNLVCGNISQYTGFVPEKNLSDIENFKLREQDSNVFISQEGYIFKNAEILSRGGYYHIYPKNRKDDYTYSFQSDDGINFYGPDRKKLFPNDYKNPYSNNHYRFVIYPNQFLICAPLKDMELTSQQRVREDRFIEHIPDPIILKIVDGGYLIVTAWGNEASDELVVNNKLN